MTLEEYAQEVGTKLSDFYNNRDQAAVNATWRSTDDTLAENQISQQSRRTFWPNVEKTFFSTSLAFEKQANSSPHALVRSIEVALAARTGK